MLNKRSKHSRETARPEATDLQIRSFPAKLRIDCKRAALDNGQTLRDWFITGCQRLITEGRKG